MRRFDGRVALVTGAASGIGRATVARLAMEGARVFGVDVAREALAAVRDGLPPGAEVETAICDVTDEAAVEATVAACVARFGRLDVLVNVAGILRFDHFHELRTEDWNRILTVNLTGTFFMCRAAIPHLLKTRGNIVNVSSTAALGGQPWAAAYAASKGGVLALTRTIAVDYLKQGLRANSICPGDVDTPMRGVFRLPEGADPKLLHRVMSPFGPGNPASVAGVIAMLASDDGSHITGEDIRIDGGTRA
jgi:NAD(P)-dependent dehydrogenase (short-subunit alcohol dehydrogenase family)